MGAITSICVVTLSDSFPGMFWVAVPSAWNCLQNRWVLVPVGTGGAVLPTTLGIPDSSCHTTACQSWGRPFDCTGSTGGWVWSHCVFHP